MAELDSSMIYSTGTVMHAHLHTVAKNLMDSAVQILPSANNSTRFSNVLSHLPNTVSNSFQYMIGIWNNNKKNEFEKKLCVAASELFNFLLYIFI